jgi:signal transduction histidine kinase
VHYNKAMRGKLDVIKLLRIASLLWLAYLGISATIDYVLKNPGPIEQFLYVADAGIAIFFLVISYIPLIQEKLGKAFLPLMIFLTSALPITINQIAIRFIFTGPLPPPEAMLTRVIPFLLIALLLISWQYKWRYMVAFCLALALVNVGILWAFVPNDRGAFTGGLFAIMTQVISFLVVGFFINVMVGWLRKQQRSLEEANAKLTNYAQTLEDLAVTKERSRIAQELHDTLSHTLSGLSVQLETMKAYWDVDPITARKRLDKSLIAIRSGLEETRRILMALRAKPLEDLGLSTAIQQMAQEAAAHAGIALDLIASDHLPSLSPNTEQCIFRVAQEAITNVVKHAKAKKLTVKLEFNENRVSLIVQDDGIGFDTSDTSKDKHFGLTGMKERVEVAKGTLKIISQSGSGTTVYLTI